MFGQIGLYKPFRPRSNATKCSIWSGSTLFALVYILSCIFVFVYSKCPKILYTKVPETVQTQIRVSRIHTVYHSTRYFKKLHKSKIWPKCMEQSVWNFWTLTICYEISYFIYFFFQNFTSNESWTYRHQLQSPFALASPLMMDHFGPL